MDKKLLHRYSTHRTEARSLTHESSSVGARSSSAAPVGQDHGPNTRALFVGAFHISGRGGSVRRGRPGTAALRLKSVPVLGQDASVRRWTFRGFGDI